MTKMGALLSAIVLLGSAVAQTSFRAYTSPDAKFRISFPGTPNVSAPIQQQTDEGNTFTEQHYAVSDDAAYMLLTADYPFAVDDSALEATAKQQALSCGAPPATIRSHRNVQGRSALLFTVDCPKTDKHAAISLMVQAVANGNRLYRIMYGNSENPDRARAESFLISFHMN